MPDFKKETRDGKLIHFSVGALIERDGKYLLMDRKQPPLGFAGIAGHVDEGETPEESLERELKEETTLDITDKELIFEELVEWNWCRNGAKSHYWYLYKCETEGTAELAEKKEQKSIGWYSPEEIKELELEEVWEYWFKKLEII